MTFWKGFTIVDALRMWFVERGKNININTSWEDVDSSLHGILWEVQDSVEEVTADVEIARELEVEPADVTELLQSHDKTSMNVYCFLRMSKVCGFLR